MADNWVKAGDVVCLKSGGPLMTVQSVGKEAVTCVWFANNMPQEDDFEIVLLRLATTIDYDTRMRAGIF